MKSPSKVHGTRKPYAKPVLTVVSEKEILEAIGPAQGYGGGATMPLDSEWSRRS
jgi:hypothetical protein